MRKNTNDYYNWNKMTISISNKCDLTCKMCSIVREPKSTLSEELAMHCAEFAEKHGFEEIEITGGEPTLVKYFWRLLDRLCQIDGPMIKITTNAVRLSDEKIRELASYPELYVQVSIDGLAQTHNRIREEKNAFERSAANVHKFAEAGLKNLSINTVVMRSNYREMIDVYEYFKPLPLLFHAFPLVQDLGTCPEEEIPREECDELIAVLSEIMRRGKADGNNVILTDALIGYYRWRAMYPYYTTHPGRGCTVVKKGLIITSEGHVRPCWDHPWETDTSKRNLNERTLDEIVDDPEIRAELDHAIGWRGCLGCSTMCYNWDPEFREKVMNPKGLIKVRHLYHQNKEKLRDGHPRIYAAAKAVRSALSR